MAHVRRHFCSLQIVQENKGAEQAVLFCDIQSMNAIQRRRLEIHSETAVCRPSLHPTMSLRITDFTAAKLTFTLWGIYCTDQPHVPSTLIGHPHRRWRIFPLREFYAKYQPTSSECVDLSSLNKSAPVWFKEPHSAGVHVYFSVSYVYLETLSLWAQAQVLPYIFTEACFSCKRIKLMIFSVTVEVDTFHEKTNIALVRL